MEAQAPDPVEEPNSVHSRPRSSTDLAVGLRLGLEATDQIAREALYKFEQGEGKEEVEGRAKRR